MKEQDNKEVFSSEEPQKLSNEVVVNHLDMFNTDIKIDSVTLNKENNEIEVVMREPSNEILTSFPPKAAPDKVWKNVFAVNEKGEIYFKERLEGTVVPKQVIPERVEFKKS